MHYIQRTGYEDEYPAHYRAMLEEVRKAVPLVAFPTGEAPRWELVPDDFVKYHLTVGTQSECLKRLRDLMTLKPDEICFAASSADIDLVPKWAALVEQLQASAL